MHPSSRPPPSVSGTDRFVLKRRLGEGAYGVVFEAWDRERNLTVALKRLHQVHPSAIYRFKREFRALSDLSHPNLVQLHELLWDGTSWCFTMELVRGRPLLAWLRPELFPRVRPPAEEDAAETMDAAMRDRVDTDVHAIEPIVLGDEAPSTSPLDDSAPHRMPPPTLDAEYLARVRAVFSQLATGVHTLHLAGKLHRDLKSQNVIVDERGRVVLLDFGLVQELGTTSGLASVDREIVGTPVTMAPEQCLGGSAIGEEADWYAVGVMLFQALTGAFPFDGTALAILVAKQTQDAPRASSIVPSVPPELDALCTELLARDPQKRLRGRAAVERLGRTSETPEVITTRSGVFVGRRTELARLSDAFDGAARGRGRTVLVHGRSGMGKSALVRRFLDELAGRSSPPILLEARCYARESLPYKALDGIVDSLVRYLSLLSEREVAELAPRRVGELALLFPVLRKLRPIDRLDVSGAPPDPVERRRRAFDALRELLSRLGRARPLVLYVDDLHWGDVESAQALAQILQPPDPPPLLLVGTYRSDEASTSAFLRAFEALESPASLSTERIEIGPLPSGDAETLAAALLGDRSSARIERTAREAAGSPLFVEQLAQAALERVAQRQAAAEASGNAHDSAERSGAGDEEPSLSGVIERRIRDLPPEARRVIEILAVAGQPLDHDVLRAASAVSSLDAPEVRLLRTQKLVRARTRGRVEQVEIYHDRIRETAAGTLGAEAELAAHRRIAEALENKPTADPEMLAVHWRACGEDERALGWAVRAADRAAAALAFDRSARLYRMAIEIGRRVAGPRDDTPDEGALQVRLGDSLRNAGRGADAARAFLAAADRESGGRAVELRRQATEQLLSSGHFEEGQRVLAEVLRAVGMSMPAGTPRALFEFLSRRAWLRVRGLEFERRPAGTVTDAERLKMEVCWTIAIGLAMIDPVRGGIFQSEHLLLALRSGDVARVARALAVEVPFSATPGPKNRERTAELTRRARLLAAEVDDPFLHGLLTSSIGGAAWLEGRWEDALALEEQAATILRAECTGVAWSIDTTEIVLLDCLHRLGDLRAVMERYPAILADARVRGDLYMEVYCLLKFASLARLMEGQLDEAQGEVDRAIARWTGTQYSLLHFWQLHLSVEIDLLRGKPDAARTRLDSSQKALDASLLTQQLFMYRVTHLDLCVRVELARAEAARSASARSSALSAADAITKKIESEQGPWASALASAARACAASLRGARDRTELAMRAIDRLDAAGLRLQSDALRARVAEESGDPAALERAHSAIGDRGVRDPARWARLLAPWATR